MHLGSPKGRPAKDLQGLLNRSPRTLILVPDKGPRKRPGTVISWGARPGWHGVWRSLLHTHMSKRDKGAPHFEHAYQTISALLRERHTPFPTGNNTIA